MCSCSKASAACVVLALLLINACTETSLFPDGGSGDSAVIDIGPIPDSYINPCAPAAPPTITGQVFAPNGTDPVSGAVVGIPLALNALPAEVQCESCALPGKFSAVATASFDGTFSLTGIPNDGQPFKLAIQKGLFRRVLDVTVPPCGTLALDPADSTLPGATAQYGPNDTVPKIAVITGVWDKLEKVLTKLGVTERTIFDGTVIQSGAGSVQALMQNGALMRQFHMIFINCGTVYEQLITSPGPARNNLREYVRRGGKLFVTDYAYDFVEQVFPDLIDFQGSESTPTTEPEAHNAAEVGSPPGTLEADVLDSRLKDWLGLAEIGALLPNGKLQIIGFQPTWAVQRNLGSSTSALIEGGPVSFIGGTDVVPLTSSAKYQVDGGCGRIVFSSYHTHGDDQQLLPQERVLEYLMLELGECVPIL